MALFIRLARLTEKGHQDIRHMDKMIEQANQIIHENGARTLASYVILGEYDVLSILEAPDERTAAKIGALIATQGNFRAETFAAIPTEEFIKTLSE